SDVEELNVEDQRGVWRNAVAARTSISETRRNDQRTHSADLHPWHALIPSGNHLTGAEREREWLARVVRALNTRTFVIWCGRAVQPQCVVHRDQSASCRLGASPDRDVNSLKRRDAAVR